MDKKRVLVITETSFGTSTGFGRYANELMSRLYASGKYILAEHAAYCTKERAAAKTVPWVVYPNHITEKEPGFSNFASRPQNVFGEWKFDETVLSFKPDICLAFHDPWMMSYQAFSVLRDHYHLVWMPTVDSLPQQDEWLDWFSSADDVLLYSDWAKNEMLAASGGEIKYRGTASPCVDYKVFKPLNRSEIRKSFGLDDDHFIVGMVARNQPRKLFPQLFGAIRRLIDSSSMFCQRGFLLLHTSYPDKGWNLPLLLKEHSLHNKVLFTYLCQDTGKLFITPFQGEKTISPFTRGDATMTFTGRGCSSEELARVYNCMDVYVQYSNCGGFEMPCSEAASCGLPVFATDYSAMSDVVRRIGGEPIKVKHFFHDIGVQANRAIPDDDHLIELCLKYAGRYQDQIDRDRERIVETTRSSYSWDQTAKAWMDIIDGTDIEPYRAKWQEKPQQHRADNMTTRDDINNKDFVQWLYGLMFWQRRNGLMREMYRTIDMLHQKKVTRAELLKKFALIIDRRNRLEAMKCSQ